MADERSLLDRIMDFVDQRLGGVITDPPQQRKRGRDADPASFGADASGASGSFDSCAGDAGGDCGGDGGGGGD